MIEEGEVERKAENALSEKFSNKEKERGIPRVKGITRMFPSKICVGNIFSR